VTKQEHELMLALFAVQMQVCGTILELLHSRGIAERGDIEAFAALAFDSVRSDFGKFYDLYLKVAKQLQVELPEGFAPSGL
jgi:hypothetical protein